MADITIHGPDGDETALTTRSDEIAHDGDAAPEQLEREVETLRGELGDLVGELDRRRREAFDVRLQLRRNASVIAVVAGAIVLLVGASLALRARRRAQRERPMARMRNLGHALAVISRDPEKLTRALEQTRDPSASLVSMLAKVAGTAGQRVVRRSL
jgi:hypothetical protein